MASPDFQDVSIFRETEIPLSVSSDNALSFFQKSGIFYQEDAEAGNLANTLRFEKIMTHHMEQFRCILMGDSVSATSS